MDGQSAIDLQSTTNGPSRQLSNEQVLEIIRENQQLKQNNLVLKQDLRLATGNMYNVFPSLPIEQPLMPALTRSFQSCQSDFPPSFASLHPGGHQQRQPMEVLSWNAGKDNERDVPITSELMASASLERTAHAVVNDESHERPLKRARMNLSNLSEEQKKERRKEQGRERQRLKRERDKTAEGSSSTALKFTKHFASNSSNTSSEKQIPFNNAHAPPSNRSLCPEKANWTFDSSQMADLLHMRPADFVLPRKALAIEFLRSWKIPQLPFNNKYLLPHAADFCSFKEVREILEQPIGEEVTLSSFDNLHTTMPIVVREWQHYHQRKFIDLFEGDLEVPFCMDSDEFDLFSACMASPLNVFRCKQCCNILFCPSLFSHSCLRRDRNTPILINSDLDDLYELDKSIALESGDGGLRTPLRIGILKFSTKASAVAKDIIRLVGLEAERVTVDEMDGKDPLFACNCCARTVDGKEGYASSRVFSWKGAIRHRTRCCDSNRDHVFHVLTPDQKAKAKLLCVDDFGDEDIQCWSCIHCMEWPCQVGLTQLKYVKSHLRYKHEIETPEINKDYYKDYVELDECGPFNRGWRLGSRMELEMDAEECSAF